MLLGDGMTEVRRRLRRTARARIAAVGGTTAAIGLVAGLVAVVRSRLGALARPGPADPADALTLLLGSVALLLLLWLVLGVVLEALAAMPGRVGRGARWAADRLTPALVARFAALLIGAAAGAAVVPGSAVAAVGEGASSTSRAVATAPDPGFRAADIAAPQQPAGGPEPDPGLYPSLPGPSASSGMTAPSGPAQRATGSAPEPGFGGPLSAPARRSGGTAGSVTRAGAVPPAPDPGFVPQRPAVRPVLSPTLLGGRGIPAPEGVVVHRGDTLWSIAAAWLGPDATDAEIARAWPRWYAENRGVIGDDPDRIRPGQVLHPPALESVR